MPVAAVTAATGVGVGVLILTGMLVMLVLVALLVAAWRRGSVKVKLRLPTLCTVDLELDLTRREAPKRAKSAK